VSGDESDTDVDDDGDDDDDVDDSALNTDPIIERAYKRPRQSESSTILPEGFPLLPSMSTVIDNSPDDDDADGVDGLVARRRPRMPWEMPSPFRVPPMTATPFASSGGEQSNSTALSARVEDLERQVAFLMAYVQADYEGRARSQSMVQSFMRCRQ
jgi:hypothetical protein